MFYSYITNPRDFNPDNNIETLADLKTIPTISEYEDCLEVNTYQNGPMETRIHVKNPSLYKEEAVEEQKDDEKVDISTITI